MKLRQILEEEMLRRLRIPNNDASVKRFSAYAARLYKESYGSDFDGPGLVVTARTTRDNNLIKDIVEDHEFIAYWNAREGYWFFPEEVETLDSLENALSEIFDDIGVNASFESQE